MDIKSIFGQIKYYLFLVFFFSVEIKSVETSDGSKHSEVGEFKYVGGLTVRGSYEFVDDDGKVHKVSILRAIKLFF